MLAWGVIGLGAIARKFSAALAYSDTGRLVAVGSRNRDSAEKFGADFPGVRKHGSYEALLADPDVQAVYIATPHPLHAEWVIKCAEAGKHILCEKPAAMNFHEATAMIQAVRKHRVFFMEAFMYRFHPQTARLVELICDGAIGAVSLIEASFGVASRFDPSSRLWSNELGGGGIMDLGCYPVSMARLLAGALTNRAFANPRWVRGGASLHPETGVDQWAAGLLGFEGGVLAQVAASVAVWLENRVRIYGSKGKIEVIYPWNPDWSDGNATIEIWRSESAILEKVSAAADRNLYALEADAVGRTIRDGKLECDAMSWEDTLGNALTLDQWREQAGVRYLFEGALNVSHTLSR